MPQRSRVNLKLLESTMSTAELPSTMPALIESHTQRLTWQRQVADLNDERGLIDQQIASAERIHGGVCSEAQAIQYRRVQAAQNACDRAVDDADAILDATRSALQQRQADLDRTLAGLQAALDATPITAGTPEPQ